MSARVIRITDNDKKESFSRRTKSLADPSEVREIYEEFLARKDAEIERLKKENDILLRMAIKNRKDRLER
jgi:hypothetical protein